MKITRRQLISFIKEAIAKETKAPRRILKENNISLEMEDDYHVIIRIGGDDAAVLLNMIHGYGTAHMEDVLEGAISGIIEKLGRQYK